MECKKLLIALRYNLECIIHPQNSSGCQHLAQQSNVKTRHKYQDISRRSSGSLGSVLSDCGTLWLSGVYKPGIGWMQTAQQT
ncbi:hypothetical protein T4B_11543 [Trichinella pseudospiralis]|uniref:Uncharacterized protein n=1 Tax=Trichinella pseudospiralis TaxID=6337 RepID=A0A0V1K2C6_TRIPS|nr:hypothetical protein T4B_11543 [Trichinella pseudospiralis]KRZ41391.1 hypothetical protein T4C_11725 [Trichinella pseudospiralis]